MKRNLNCTVLFSVLMIFFLHTQIAYSQTWEPTNGPFGGSISCLAKNGPYLFAGAGSGLYGNGVFRSADNGAHWTALTGGLTTLNSFVVSGSYIIASGGTGIYRSNDNGDTWTQSTYPGANIANVLASDGTYLYAGGYSGFYVSADNGLTWTGQNSNFPGIGAGNAPDVWSMAVCGPYLYVGTSGQGIFRSADHGTTWTEVYSGIYTTGTPSNKSSFTFFNLVVVGTDVYVGAGGQGVYHLVNNGSTWVSENTGLTPSAKVILTMILKDSLLYCGGNDGLWTSNPAGTLNWVQVYAGEQFKNLLQSDTVMFTGLGTKGVFLSSDNGSTWITKNQGINGLSTRQILKGNGSDILAATYEGMVYKSVDQGANWTIASNINSGTNAFVLHGTTFFTEANGGEYRSTDNGATWEVLSQCPVLAYTHYSKGDTIFVGGTNSAEGVDFSVDNGDTWNAVSGIDNSVTGGYPIVISMTSHGSNMFAGTNNGAFNSTDNGLTWNSCSPGLTQDMPVSCLADNGTYVFAGTSNYWEDPNIKILKGLFRSSDNGVTWKTVNIGLANLDIRALEFNGTDIYAGTLGGIFKSSDNGDHWTTFDQGFPTPPKANSLYIEGNYIYSDNWTVPTPVYRRALSGSVPEQPNAIIGVATPCANSTQTYTVTGVAGVTYVWQFPSGWNVTSGGTADSVIVTVGSKAGAVLVTPGNGWGSGPAQFLAVSPQSPATPVISQSGTTLSSNSPSGNQWYLNDTIIQGATNQTYEVISNGNYKVVVSSTDCISGVSNIIAMVITGINDKPSIQNPGVYPNPTKGIMSLNLKGNTGDIKIVIKNTLGGLISSENVNVVSGNFTKTIDLSKYPTGIYYLQIIGNGKTHIQKLVKQ